LTLEQQQQQQNQQQQEKYYRCYYCYRFETDNESKYITHGVNEHLYKPLFPNEVEIIKYNLPPQGKPWEKCNITVKEANDRLSKWAEKRKKVKHHQKQSKLEEKEKEIPIYDSDMDEDLDI
jgi:hypothetical protein